MDGDALESFYENLGFELVEIDDRETLFIKLMMMVIMSTITDEDGGVPTSLNEPIIFNLYDDMNSFQWSVTVEILNTLVNYLLA